MLRIVLGAGVAQLEDETNGTVLAEPAVVAIDRQAGLPFRAGWAALTHDDVMWPFEGIRRAHLEPDPEPRRCLLGHLLRDALARRPWWDRILRPAVLLVVPDELPGRAIRVLQSDAVFAGAARNVRVDRQATEASAPARSV